MNESIRMLSRSRKKTPEPQQSQHTLLSWDHRRRLCKRSRAWRSLVARLLWKREVGGSNPVAPNSDRIRRSGWPTAKQRPTWTFPPIHAFGGFIVQLNPQPLSSFVRQGPTISNDGIQPVNNAYVTHTLTGTLFEHEPGWWNRLAVVQVTSP